MKKRDLLSIADMTRGEIEGIILLARALKEEIKLVGHNEPVLQDQTLAMIFEKPSLRTRLSFEVAMTQLGGHAVYLSPSDIALGQRESVYDVGKVVGSMASGVMARVFDHKTIVSLAQASDKPVINGLSDREHPCQILADLLTIQEKKGRLDGLIIAFVGDGENNITHSLALAAGLMGFHLRVASPKGYGMNAHIVSQAQALAATSGGSVTQGMDPADAVKNADIVYTDTWISMGDEAQKEARLKAFVSFGVTQSLMKIASPQALFMHDLPAYRGLEVSSDVIDGPQSIVFDQAENRLHAQKAVLLWLMGEVLHDNTKKGLI
jgi:ornithine carbamoyltransferase